MMRPGPKAPYRLKDKLKLQPNCVWCGKPMNMDPNSPHVVTREHIIPKSLGKGKWYWQLLAGHGYQGPFKNIVLACRICNVKRANNLYYITEHTPQWIRHLIRCIRELQEKDLIP